MKLTHKTNKSTTFIFDYLTDMQKFVSVHPVIYKMEKLEGNNYKVFETLKFGFIPYSFTYPATVSGNVGDQRVVMKATVMKMNKVEMTFDIREENGFAVVDEEVIIKSPFKGMMKGIFRKQHLQLFENIGKVK